MKRAILARDRVIDFIGARGAMPALSRESDEPRLLRPGEDESSLRRVGWKDFFCAIEERGLVLVGDEAAETLDYQFVPWHQARSFGHRPTLLETIRSLPVPMPHG